MVRTALITGSTSGIGYSIAIAFAQAGYKIMFHGLETNGLEIAKEAAVKYNVETSFSNANLMHPNEVENLVKKTFETFGAVDVLINNAGIQFVSPVDEFPLEKWNSIIAVNLTSAFIASKAVWGGMKKSGFGRIINISSVHGLRASEYKSAYVSSKHGILGLTKVLGLEGAGSNITCNAICPGYVKTPLVEGQIKDQSKAHGLSEEDVIQKVMLKKQAVKEFIPEEKISELALFLAAENSSAITGSSFTLDGGWTSQ
ncbi:D-beta-hydroxybutyrate dehydrogenase [Psychroflexus torquis ATCC 700755]|jgi:3-hydroxybutyrate dehydrogenase|uniref:D-beta-hydroxybutyrate dehydrogenase n=1 Tax=Psychroflexus torquis (strain ATCC 700755 / CIP 106069 / ACAM 623) TaxID=313595 RepID=K4IBF7_PSYTT|nr:3-hydroxybutyrate dehydrogenase [Psychroflexus torquis]AFU67764.1 D-beta-hydroxybutyrate dehydrogenase [Psychroflexus torquis ATCC 700755]